MKNKTLVAVSLGVFTILIVSICLLNPADSSAGEKILAQGNNDQVPPGLKKIPPGLEKIVFIHYKKGADKNNRPVKPDKPGKPTSEPECYGFLANGVKWNTDINVFIDNNISDTFGTKAIIDAAEEWDQYTPTLLFQNWDVASGLDWDGDPGDQPDSKNELLFGDYPDGNVIAVTVVWGRFSGPPKFREIFEFDILFNTDFSWGDTGDSSVMDLQNIATHELGHGLGLGDIYVDSCSDVTMYGYSGYGETSKRTLEGPDVTGLQELYGQ